MVPSIPDGTDARAMRLIGEGTAFRGPKQRRSSVMLGWAITFLIIAIIAGVFGFAGIASASAGIAQILFFIFLFLFLVAAVARAVQGRPPV